jgi:arginyl-tRNA synthetase
MYYQALLDYVQKAKANFAKEHSEIDLAQIAVEIEHPKERKFGHYSTNLAMFLAKVLKVPPRRAAVDFLPYLEQIKPVYLEKITVEGAGFINFYLSPTGLTQVLLEILARKELYGRSEVGKGRKIQVEFVSANPVGPLHLGHGRWAALGDAIARLLEATGFTVEREFYINDFGTQMQLFGASLEARYMQHFQSDYPFPEEGYRGEYLKDLAAEIVAAEGASYLQLLPAERRLALQELGYQKVLQHIKTTLKDFGVDFQVWFSERQMRKQGEVEETLAELKSRGYTYEKEGALWFKSSALGDSKDNVLIKSNGEDTYFLKDIAYHRNKSLRGFDILINILGADHAGHQKRMEAAMRALGCPAKLEIIIGQMVNLKGGRMSKRSGEMVTFEELVKEVGKDAARFFFLMKNANSTLDFDLELAVAQNLDNPVYYLQYAHARICSIFKTAASMGVELKPWEQAELELLNSLPEILLLEFLERFPSLVRESALSRAPHNLTHYLIELARLFHSFYNSCRVLGEAAELQQARLALIAAVRQVIVNGCNLLGISTPESM